MHRIALDVSFRPPSTIEWGPARSMINHRADSRGHVPAAEQPDFVELQLVRARVRQSTPTRFLEEARPVDHRSSAEMDSRDLDEAGGERSIKGNRGCPSVQQGDPRQADGRERASTRPQAAPAGELLDDHFNFSMCSLSPWRSKRNVMGDSE